MTTHRMCALQSVLYWEKTHQILRQALLLLVYRLRINASVVNALSQRRSSYLQRGVTGHALEIPTFSAVDLGQ